MNPASVTSPGGDTPHGPPPSLWPVGFAVGIVCILVGGARFKKVRGVANTFLAALKFLAAASANQFDSFIEPL